MPNAALLRRLLLPIGLVAGTAVAILLASISADQTPDLTSSGGSPLAVADAYALMTRAMSQPGMVLHIVVTYSDQDASVWPSAVEVWIDEGGHRVRRHAGHGCRSVPPQQRNTQLSVDGGWYFIDGEGKPQRGATRSCRETDLPGLLFLLNCGGDREVVTQARSDVPFEGRSAVEIRSTGELQGIDSRITIDSSFYVDSQTGFPLATLIVTGDYYGIADTAEPTTHESAITYTSEYVERSSLAKDFFDPDGIGVKPAYPAAVMDVQNLSLQMYWLGETLSASRSLPGLALNEASVFDFDHESLLLGYRLTNDEFGRSVVSIITVSPEQFDSGPTGWPHSEACFAVEDVSLDGPRNAVLGESRDDGGCSFSRYALTAVLHYAESVVVVDVVDEDAPWIADNPYATREAFLTILRALTEFPRR